MKYHSTSGLKEYKIYKKKLLHKYKKIYKNLDICCHLWSSNEVVLDRIL